MQNITITGRCGSDAATRVTNNGDKVTSGNVAVDQGYGDSKTTNWFRVSIWGARGEKLAQYITKGEKIVVTGELTFDTYEGKPQYNVRANDLDCFMSSKGGATQRDSGPRGGGGGSSRSAAFDSDLDDDVPFVRCDGMF